MTSLEPREPYSAQELTLLYPKKLKLQLVQILLRHGERTPISARFQSAGLTPYWPYCSVAKHMASAAIAKTELSTWEVLQWRRRFETFGVNDASVLASGSKGEVDALCQPGELTDKGRATSLALGQRLRFLYVDQLRFMPKIMRNADIMYLRSTPSPRALESIQQCFWGMYPPSPRTASFPPPTITLRMPADETLLPNQKNCPRFSQLSRAFAQRTADRWNHREEMDYLTYLIAKWMPEGTNRVAVDSHPRLSGIMDTINSTLAHDPEVRLPSEFYDPKGRGFVEKISMEEWFSGYTESHEYREVGIGSLLGDIVARMVGSLERRGNVEPFEVGYQYGDSENFKGGKKKIKFAMSGCHDTTLAAILCSLGAFENENWPPFTSHLAIELFETEPTSGILDGGEYSNPWESVFSTFSKRSLSSTNIARKRLDELTPSEAAKMKGSYVRIRYNDQPVYIPGCKPPGKHFEDDQSFCTLETFKAIVDKFTPRNWKEACNSNLDKPCFPKEKEPAGY